MNNKIREERVSTREFVKAFVADLAAKRVCEIKSRDEDTQQGFERVVQFLEREIASMARRSEKARSDWYHDIVFMRNELAPSLTGVFDNFEYYLRSLQNSYTECPNPWYDKILIRSSAHLVSIDSGRAGRKQRNLVRRAVGAYLSAFK